MLRRVLAVVLVLLLLSVGQDEPTNLVITAVFPTDDLLRNGFCSNDDTMEYDLCELSYINPNGAKLIVELQNRGPGTIHPDRFWDMKLEVNDMSLENGTEWGITEDWMTDWEALKYRNIVLRYSCADIAAMPGAGIKLRVQPPVGKGATAELSCETCCARQPSFRDECADLCIGEEEGTKGPLPEPLPEIVPACANTGFDDGCCDPASEDASTTTDCACFLGDTDQVSCESINHCLWAGSACICVPGYFECPAPGGKCYPVKSGVCCEGSFHECCLDEDCGEGSQCKEHSCSVEGGPSSAELPAVQSIKLEVQFSRSIC